MPPRTGHQFGPPPMAERPSWSRSLSARGNGQARWGAATLGSGGSSSGYLRRVCLTALSLGGLGEFSTAPRSARRSGSLTDANAARISGWLLIYLDLYNPFVDAVAATWNNQSARGQLRGAFAVAISAPIRSDWSGVNKLQRAYCATTSTLKSVVRSRKNSDRDGQTWS